MLRLRSSLLIPVVALSGACGGGSPTGPSPTPPPSGSNSLTAVVFYDENGNGILDPSEGVRLPGVTVSAAGRTVSTESSGRAVVSGLPGGSLGVSIQSDTLPPYFRPGATVSVSLPQAPGAEAALPATLPIGGNLPNRYMAWGDSITVGDGSSDASGYRNILAADLRAHWGRAELINEGISGARSTRGAQDIGGSLAGVRPAYTLILYGTNDWNNLACRDAFPCDTVDNIRSMIRQCRTARSLPVVGTIIPVNPNFVDRDATERNQWVTTMNTLVRPMVQQEGGVLADLHAAMLREPNLASLFTDRVHPNDRGYQIIEQEWRRALVTPSPATAPLSAAFFRAP